MEGFGLGANGYFDVADQLARYLRRRAAEREGYAIELVSLESLPDFPVTANCDVPPGDGRFTVFDVGGDCDVPQVLAALDDRDVPVRRTTD